MTEVESVALWVGLFASIVGIVLALVSMTFTWLVNKRTDRLTERTLKELERIELKVQGVSDDVTQLVRKAWDRMLDGGFPAQSDSRASSQAREDMLGGVAEEIISERAPAGERVTLDEGDLQELLRRWSTVPLENLPIEDMVLKVNSLSGLSRALLAILADSRHLTSDQFKSLLNSPVAQAVHELRGAGLLVPVKAFSPGPGRPPIVYWLPSTNAETIQAAALLADKCVDQQDEVVRAALEEVGYFE